VILGGRCGRGWWRWADAAGRAGWLGAWERAQWRCAGSGCQQAPAPPAGSAPASAPPSPGAP
jgi:hypothetical protein